MVRLSITFGVCVECPENDTWDNIGFTRLYVLQSLHKMFQSITTSGAQASQWGSGQCPSVVALYRLICQALCNSVRDHLANLCPTPLSCPPVLTIVGRENKT